MFRLLTKTLLHHGATVFRLNQNQNEIDWSGRNSMEDLSLTNGVRLNLIEFCLDAAAGDGGVDGRSGEGNCSMQLQSSQTINNMHILSGDPI